MNFIQKIAFLSGQNSDTTPELNKGFPYLHNVRILSSNDNSEGAITTVNGNTLVTFTLPTGTNTCIGYCQDKLKQKGYAFIYNTLDNHSILEYDEVANTIRFVLRNKPSFDSSAVPLNFKKDWLITSAEVIALDENNDLLYWTDGYINPSDASDYNEPKKINIQKGILYMTSSGTDTEGYLAPFDPHYIDRIKQPPPPPTYIWAGVGIGGLQWAVGSLVGRSTPAPSAPLIFPFDEIVTLNAPALFNDTTFIGTVPFNGYYDITILLYPAAVSGTATGKMHLYLNGVSIANATSPVVGVLGGQVSITLVAQDALLLTAGDELSVYCETLDNNIYWGPGLPSWIPGVGFTVTYLGTTNREIIINNLFKKLFQFQINWKYDDKEETVLSKKTDFILPKTDQRNGEDYYIQQNAIILTVPTGNSIVKKIRIYAHEIGMVDNTETGLSDLALVVELDKESLGIADDDFYEYLFLNDGNYTPVSLQLKNQLFDFVYYYNKCLARFQNRIADANGAEGVDAVKIDMRLPINFDEKVDAYPINTFFPKRSYLKSGGIYEYGIVYYFNGLRSGNTNTTVGDASSQQTNGNFGTRLYVPFLTETGYTAPHGSPNLDMEYVPTVKGWIYNEPPKDATNYEIVRSKNQAIASYIQFLGDIRYSDLRGNTPTTAGACAYVYITVPGITGIYKEEFPSSLLVYDWTKGDRVRVIARTPLGSGPTTAVTNLIYPFQPFFELEVVAYDSQYSALTCSYSPGFPFDPTNPDLILFEVYTPAKNIENDNELIFEVGETGTIGTDVNGNKVHVPDANGKATVDQLFDTFNEVNTYGLSTYTVVRNGANYIFNTGDNVKIIGDTGGWSIYGVITTAGAIVDVIDPAGFTMHGTYVNGDTGTIVRCSEQEFTSGDCFRRYCMMPYSIPGIYLYRLYQYTETMNASNMFPSEAWDYGRPNRIDNDAKRSVNKARIRFSQQFIPETNINGLSTIYDLNLQDYSPQYGGIMFMFYQNERLQAYQELKVLPVLVKQQIVQSSSGTSAFVSTADSVLSPQQGTEYYLQDFGIGLHPESWAFYGNRKYFFDVKRCAIIRLSQDGLIPISMNAKMNVFFADICEKILQANAKVNCYGVYDTRFGEYILSIEPFTYSGGTFDGVTISYNEEANQFTSTWGYLPEMMGQSGVDIVSFKDGKLYTHNTNNKQNYFYDTQGSSEVWLYLNASPENVKVLQAIQQRGLAPFSVEVSNEEGQFTHLLDSNFKNVENNWYSAVFRDEHTPNIVASPPAPQYLPDAIFEGNVMRSRYFLLKFKYDGSDYNKWFSLDLKFMMSAPTVK